MRILRELANAYCGDKLAQGKGCKAYIWRGSPIIVTGVWWEGKNLPKRINCNHLCETEPETHKDQGKSGTHYFNYGYAVKIIGGVNLKTPRRTMYVGKPFSLTLQKVM